MIYLDGLKKEAPSVIDPNYVWDAENFMVMSWLVNSIETEISQRFMFFWTAKEIWDVTNIAFSYMDNGSMLHNLKRKAHEIKETR